MNTPAGTPQNIELRAQTFIRCLQDRFEDIQDEGKVPFSWTREAVGDLDVGYDIEAQALIYAQWDGEGKVVGLKRDGTTDGNPRLWPLNIKHLFDPGALKWIVFVENERAAITLRVLGFPVVCSSGGIENLPDDLSWLGQYDRVVVVLNNDASGWRAMLDLADAILRHAEVSLYRWPADTPDGFGVEEFCEIGTQEDFQKQILKRAAAYRAPVGGAPQQVRPSPQSAPDTDRIQRCREKVEGALKSAGGVLSRTALVRKTRLLKPELDETICALKDEGCLEISSEHRERKQGGGNYRLTYTWARDK